jgi:hypothetical protein
VCQGYAINAQTGITFASGEETLIVGNIGSNPTVSITGVHQIAPGGTTITSATDATGATAAMNHFNDAWTAAIAKRAEGSYTNLGDTAITYISNYTFTSSEAGTSAVYRAGAAIDFNIADSTITFDGPGDYLIQAGSTLTTAANTYCILKNGAKAENIIWALTTAATLGTDSTLDGSILAGTATSFGTKAEIRGCVITKAAATFADRGYVNVRKNAIGCSDGANQDDTCENFAINSRAGITTLASTTVTKGDIGVFPIAATAITGAATFTNGKQLTTAECTDFGPKSTFSYADLRSRREDETYWPVAVVEIGGQTFTNGTYRAGSAIKIVAGGIVTLDGPGSYLFQAGTTLTTGDGAKIILTNGAKAENVIWAFGTSVTLGANTIIQGSILTGASTTFGANAEVHGCVLSQTSVTSAALAKVGLVSSVVG